MAWRSSGRNNTELVRNMHRQGLIRSEKVLQAFLQIDRGHFVPREKRESAYQDEPIHFSPFHLSAPHMYATVLEALDLSEGQSFLNLGSGSGYLSFLVAKITGSAGVQHGIEQHKELVEHAMSRCATIPELRDINFIRFRCGDAFLLKMSSTQTYDRVYVGAGVQMNATLTFRELLNVGGVMVAPREEELVCITRVSPDTYVSRVVSHVRFQLMVEPDSRLAKVSGKLDLSQPPTERVSCSSAIGITVVKGILM
jgi:protein-L-isoaspartate(D-aspartate) O-methyltransferase